MFLSVIDWFKALQPTEMVLLIIALVLIIALIAVMISSIVTNKRARLLASEDSVQKTKAEGNAPVQNFDSVKSDSTEDKNADTNQNEQETLDKNEDEVIPKIEQNNANEEDSSNLSEQENEAEVKTEPVAEPVKKPSTSKPASKPVPKTKKDNADAKKVDNIKDADDEAELEQGKNVAEVVEEIQSNERKHGKIVIYKDNNGRYRFRIVAANHEPVGHSRSYGTKSACKSGVKAMLKYSGTEVNDLTLQNNTYKPKIGTASFEIYLDDENKYRFRLRSKNYKLVLASQGYTTKGASQVGIDSVKRISENYSLES